MGVLHIGAGLAVEVQHLVPGEGVVLDPVVGKFLEDHGADAHLLRHFVDVLVAHVLFQHDFPGLFHGAVQHVFQEDDLALTGGHGAVVQTHQPEGDVDALVRPVEAHEFDDLEPLLEMQVLLGRHHVDVLVKVIVFLPVYRRGDVPGNVQGGTVLLPDEGRAHVVG